MKVKFTKMHGAGNDFVVLDAVRQSFALTPEKIRALAHRNFGVGFDQLLVVEPPAQAGNDFRYRIYNGDGGEVEQCGNGARCFARFVRDQGLSAKDELRVETARGVIVPRIEADGEVTVNMGAPRFRHADVPFVPAHALTSDATANRHVLAIEGEQVSLCVVSMGNPHAVVFVSDVANAPVSRLGPLIERHPAFPARVNVGFAEAVNDGALRLRVWERSAGETLACGSGACAAAVCAIQQGYLKSPATVHARGGTLTLAWGGLDSPVFMTGPAASVFAGEIDL
jgi:diaminopimelate epimerase